MSYTVLIPPAPFHRLWIWAVGAGPDTLPRTQLRVEGADLVIIHLPTGEEIRVRSEVLP